MLCNLPCQHSLQLDLFVYCQHSKICNIPCQHSEYVNLQIINTVIQNIVSNTECNNKPPYFPFTFNLNITVCSKLCAKSQTSMVPLHPIISHHVELQFETRKTLNWHQWPTKHIGPVAGRHYFSSKQAHFLFSK